MFVLEVGDVKVEAEGGWEATAVVGGKEEEEETGGGREKDSP